MTYGIKATRTGESVMTAADKDLAFSTEYPSIAMQEDHVGILDYTFPDSPGVTRTLITVAHGYSYTPLAMVYVKDVTTGHYATLRYGVAIDIMSGKIQEFHYYTDATNFKILFRVTSGAVIDMTGRQYVFKYFIWTQQGM